MTLKPRACGSAWCWRRYAEKNCNNCENMLHTRFTVEGSCPWAWFCPEPNSSYGACTSAHKLIWTSRKSIEPLLVCVRTRLGEDRVEISCELLCCPVRLLWLRNE